MKDIIVKNGTPNPGSRAAVELGCTCATIDNHYGDGISIEHGPWFWISMDCPLHTEMVNTDAKG